ncbi:hypothetical protein H1R20_g7238, partial [Candolleomyces eurysporus]
MPSSDLLACINPNSDVSGVGVRVVIYVQALFNIICTIIFSRDTSTSDFEHMILTTTSLSLLIGCALSLCMILKSSTLGLTAQHALIILNLNWIVGLGALLHVFIRSYNGIAALFDAPVKPKGDNKTPAGKSRLYLSTLHLCGTGGVGILVWKTTKKFEDYQEYTPLTGLTVFGKDVGVVNATLRRAPLVIYWMAALPLINLLIVFLAALAVIRLITCVYPAIRYLPFKSLPWRTFSLFGGLFVIVLLEISLIVDTEVMISRQALVKEEEETWTFGHILALVVFFFSSFAGLANRRSKRCLVATLAYQLVQHESLGDVGERILSSVERNPAIFERQLEVQLEQLLLQPLREARENLDVASWPKVIIIDGLDECEAEQYGDIARSPHVTRTKEADQTEILQALLKAANDPSFPFRIIIASRPEPAIQSFTDVASYTTRKIFLDEKYNPDADMSLFLECKFAVIRRRYQLPASWPSNTIKQTTVQNASGQFVYVATVMRFIEGSSAPPTRTTGSGLATAH